MSDIDHEAVKAALTTPPRKKKSNRLPVTGRCHTCDRVVSGERRYCGSCLVKRGTT